MKGGADEEPMVGGAKRRSRKGSRKASRKGSRKGSKKGSHKGSRKPNPGFMAFQKLKKHVADCLKIPNSVQAAKIAGAALKKIKSAHPDMDSVKASAEAIKEFDNNMDKYKKML